LPLMPHDTRTAHITRTKAQPLDDYDQDTRRRQHNEGVAARDRNVPFDGRKPRQWKMGWLLSDETDEIMKTATYQGLAGDFMDFALETFDAAVTQLAAMGCPPAQTIAHLLSAYGIKIGPELLDEIEAIQEESADEDEDDEEDDKDGLPVRDIRRPSPRSWRRPQQAPLPRKSVPSS
jgi:hypothetical protein